MKVIQLVLIVVYLILTILIGLLSSRKKTSDKEFNGVGLGILMTVAVGAGEWLGGTSTTGVSEYGFLYGISGSWYTIANAIGLVVLAIFFAKMYRRVDTTTVSGLMDSYVGPKSRVVSSIMQCFILVVVGMSQFIAIGTIGETLLGWNSTVSILVFGSLVILYTSLGGMKAVGKTNIMHMLVMYTGVIVAVVVCLVKAGGFGPLTSTMDKSYFQMDTIGYSKITSWVIASILGGCIAQAGLQPILAAKDDKTAVRSTYIIALIVAPFGLLTSLLGVIAKYMFPELLDAKLGLPTLLMSLHPVVGGILTASIVAAILSTAAPILLSCATLFSRDVVFIKERENAPDNKKIVVSKTSTVVFGVICIALACVLYSMQKVLDIVYFAYSLRGAMFVILLLGMLWKKVSPVIANIAMFLTLGVGLFFVLFKQFAGSYPIAPWFNETYASILCAFIVTFVGSLIVLSVKKKKQKEATIAVAEEEKDIEK